MCGLTQLLSPISYSITAATALPFEQCLQLVALVEPHQDVAASDELAIHIHLHTV